MTFVRLLWDRYCPIMNLDIVLRGIGRPGQGLQGRRSCSGIGRCPAGSFVYVPCGTPHTFKVTSRQAGRKLNLFTPAAMVGFFEQLADAESAGAATADLLDRIAEQNEMEVLGPIPETYL